MRDEAEMNLRGWGKQLEGETITVAPKRSRD
jgi:hypothetical protein